MLKPSTNLAMILVILTSIDNKLVQNNLKLDKNNDDLKNEINDVKNMKLKK